MSTRKTASPESAYATWHDPSTYDHMRMGPPYLPGQQVRKAQAGITKQASEIGPEVREMMAAEKSAADEELVSLLGHFVNDYQGQPYAEMAALLSFLRALLVIHQTHHWQSRGATFYGDHQLFDRLYNETLPLVDSLAERTVGLGTTVLVNPIVQAAHAAAIIKSIYNGAPLDPGPDHLCLLSLKGVLRFLLLFRMVYETLEQKGLLKQSPGTDNLLQGIADSHESFAYLLKQRSSSRTASQPKWPSMIENDPRLEKGTLGLHEIKGIVDMLRKGMPAERLLQTHGAKKHKLTKEDLDEFLLMDRRGLLKSATADPWKTGIGT